MTRITNSKITNVFSFSTGSWLNWSDEPAPNQQQVFTQEAESEESQSIDSDHSSDFWHHWNPQIDKMIIARRATFLQNLEAEIAKDNLTLEISDLGRIERQIAKDETTLKQTRKTTKTKTTKTKPTKTHTLEQCSCGAL